MAGPCSYEEEDTMADIRMYSKSGCMWCEALNAFLVKRGVSFTEIKVDADIENLQELRRLLPEVKTVPQLFVDGFYVGGYNDAVEYFKDKE